LNKIIALILLILGSPLMLVISGLIKITSKGPILFKQKRHGLNGELFWFYKFRTMHDGLSQKTAVHTRKNPEQFITAFGFLLRKTSFDELPQLINILKGEMNFIGYRPDATFELETDTHLKRTEYKVYDTKPGVTGLAQIYCREILNLSFKTVVCDKFYIEHKSLFLDIKILFLTLIFCLISKDTN